MARLTRTQKYADLRSQLDNDRENQLETKELSEYSDKLKELNIESIGSDKPVGLDDINKSIDSILNESNKVVESTPLDNKVEEVKPVTLDIKPIIEEVKPVIEEVSAEEELPSENILESAEVVVNTPEVIPSQEVKTPEVEEVKEAISIEDLMSTSSVDDNIMQSTLDEVTAYNKAIGSLTVDEVPKTILNEIRGVTEEPKEDEDISNTVTLEIRKILEELDRKEEAVQEEVAPVVETPVVEEALKEEPVAIEPIASSIASEVSTVAEIKEEEKVEEVTEELVASEEVTEPLDINTDEMTIEDVRKAVDTLPKEIGDLLKRYLENTQDDVFAEPEESRVEEVAEVEELVAEELTPTADLGQTVKVDSVASVKDDTLLNKTMETGSLMNETMPLRVENTNAYRRVEEESYEDEEEGSSKFLNIILIILIVILVAVLIVVAYLILVAQGIIPSLF